jgi:RNA polymerase sigma factor (sigma-70 family)
MTLTMDKTMTDQSAPGEAALELLLGDLADHRFVLGLAAGGPRSGILRVSRAENTDFEARLTASYEKHYPSLVSYARRHGAAGPGAEDVVQQAFEKVWQRRLRPAEIDNVDAYLQTAVRHETWRELSRTRADRERYGGDPAEFPVTDGGPADHIIDRVTLRRLLDRLPRREHEAVVLRMIWDLSVREAAESMGVSPGAVKRYCSDGLHRLSDWLGAA